MIRAFYHEFMSIIVFMEIMTNIHRSHHECKIVMADIRNEDSYARKIEWMNSYWNPMLQLRCSSPVYFTRNHAKNQRPCEFVCLRKHHFRKHGARWRWIRTFLITSFNGIPTDFRTASVKVNSGTIGISVSDAVGLTVSDVVDLSFLLLFSLPPTRPFDRTRNCSLNIICENEGNREREKERK